MEPLTVLGMAAKFLSVSGEVLADVKRRELATIDVDLLKLKREGLKDGLEQLKSDVATKTVQAKGQVQQSLANRGLANSTVLDSEFRRIDQDAANELEKASREYNRAIVELALLERKVIETSKPLWKKLLNTLGVRRFG